MQSEDSILTEQFLQGDRTAQGQVEDWIGRAARPFRRRLGERWDDTLQDVRLEVVRLLRQGSFRGESTLKTYLWRVVAHTCLDRLRSQTRWKWTELDGLEGWEADSLLAERDPVRDDLAPEAKDLLLRVLEQVSEDCRRLWSMVVAGHSYREMSQRTGVPEGALRVRVLRCRKRAVELRTHLLLQPTGGPDATVR
jgi:RNA polymerase sigma factor (sigma-70 family)